ncbi:hypothetical protein H4R20_006908, partial [Coemansia guatemalensis]
ENAAFWGDGIVWSDNLWWACASFLLVLLVYERRRVPVALLIFVLGVAFALAQTGVHREFGNVHPGGHFVHAVVPTADEFRTGFLSAGLGQLPLTLLNSVVALAALARELFPGYDASMTHITMTIGVMNIVGCFLGSMPFCHGSGGLAGQYFFGARTELSLYFLGAIKIVVGVVFGESLLTVLRWFPSSFLGVMLFMAAIELGLVARNFTLHPHNEIRRRQDFVVLLATAASLVGFSHDGLGFLVGMVTALVFWGHRRFTSAAPSTEHTLLPTAACEPRLSDAGSTTKTVAATARTYAPAAGSTAAQTPDNLGPGSGATRSSDDGGRSGAEQLPGPRAKAAMERCC